MIAATHAIQTYSTVVVGVDDIRKDIEVFIQDPTVHMRGTEWSMVYLCT